MILLSPSSLIANLTLPLPYDKTVLSSANFISIGDLKASEFDKFDVSWIICWDASDSIHQSDLSISRDNFNAISGNVTLYSFSL